MSSENKKIKCDEQKLYNNNYITQGQLKQLNDWFSYCEGCDDYFLDHEDCECEQ